MKKKKWLVLTGLIALAVLLAICLVSCVLSPKPSVSVNYFELKKADLVKYVNARGVVESNDKRNVNSSLSAMVKTLKVEVGDRVSEGGLLCQLDTEDLEIALAQQQAELASARQNVQNQLKSAEVALANAQKTYDDASTDLKQDNTALIATARSSIESAKLDLDTKTTTYNNIKSLYEMGGAAKNDLDLAYTSLTLSENKYQDAQRALEDARTAAKKAMEQAKAALDTAKTAYENAKSSKGTSDTAAETALQKLEKQISDAAVKSPISGIVTAVYAKEGSSGAGLLFVVEDTNSLKITTKFKEYDIGSIAPGLEVLIKSDYTGDEEYLGVVEEIDPAALKSPTGDNIASANVEFAAKIAVTSPQTNLKIGTNARLTVITEKKEAVFCVPFDALKRNINGETVIYVAQENGAGKYSVNELKVSTGMEADFSVEISGQELTEGLKVLKDAPALDNGMEILLGPEDIL